MTIYGAVIVAGLATFFIAPYFGKILRFFPPVVTGSVITIIGITLLQVAANDAVDTRTFDATASASWTRPTRNCWPTPWARCC